MIHKSYSEKSDGNMYLSGEGFDPENVANRERYFKRIELAGKKVIAANLVHGTHVAIIDTSSPEFFLDTDALVTKEHGIVLTLTGADCFSVYFEDTTDGIIGLAHCGWRGIVGGILRETIETIESLGGTPKNISVTIGPGICGKHFEIQENILGSFSEYPEALIREGEGISVDLRMIMKMQLERLGIPREDTIDLGECTYCLPEKYLSYRRDKPDQLETQVAYIVQ